MTEPRSAHQAAHYSERLWPGAGAWIISLSAVGALAIAYGASLGPVAGWLVVAIGGGLAVVLMARAAVRLEVDDQGLRAGRAHLDWDAMGRVLAVDGDQARLARGPQGDPSAFLLLRPGVGPGAVVVEITDHQDPHRTWLLASRHPDRLARAIHATRGSLSP
ncbi:MAG: DUF3093 domain-containing protein [Candidatus Nanopelagicales bacterium]